MYWQPRSDLSHEFIEQRLTTQNLVDPHAKQFELQMPFTRFLAKLQ